MLKSLLWTVAALGALTAAHAQTIDPSSDLGQFRAFRAAGMDALDKGDTTEALAQFDKAYEVMPDSPSVLLLKAQAELQAHRLDDAHAALAEYAERGFVLDLARNPDFNQVWDGDLDNEIKANGEAVGEMRVAATLPGFTLTDAMAYAPDSNQIFAAGIRTGKVVAVSPLGSRDVITFRAGVAAYGLGLRDNMLWATTAATRQTKSYAGQDIVSKVVVINPANGQVTASFSDASQPDRRFGHLLLGRSDLYVADTTHGEVLRLAGYEGELKPLVPEGYMDAPSGLAENEAGDVLMVSDFISGLYRVDLMAGSLTRLAPPADGSLLGISSLSRYGDDLIAVENGVKPAKVLRLHMSPDWKMVEKVEVLLRSDQLVQPAQGSVSDDRFLFVAQSQWADMDEQGNPVGDAPDPAVIGVINLTPAP